MIRPFDDSSDLPLPPQYDFSQLAASEELSPELMQPLDFWMLKAIEQANIAYEMEEVPVGAIIVHQGRVIGTGYNQRESLNDPTAHAEMLAITQAASTLESWRLTDCAMFVTLEPCPMCAGAIVQARIPTIIYGATDPKAGACHSLYNITADQRLNHRCAVLGGVLQEECKKLLQDFFAEQRAKGKK